MSSLNYSKIILHIIVTAYTTTTYNGRNFMKITRIILDQDELLTDFVGAACKLWGTTTQEVVKNWEPGKWDMTGPVGLTVLGKKLTDEEFWERINGDDEFWENMPSTPFRQELLAVVVQVVRDNYHIVSSPSRCPTCYNGKVKWLKREFGNEFNRFALTPHKEIFAQPGVLLIDDRDSNVENFIKHGGAGIVFPTHHNSKHEFKHDPVLYVYEQLKEMKCI